MFCVDLILFHSRLLDRFGNDYFASCKNARIFLIVAPTSKIMADSDTPENAL